MLFSEHEQVWKREHCKTYEAINVVSSPSDLGVTYFRKVVIIIKTREITKVCSLREREFFRKSLYNKVIWRFYFHIGMKYRQFWVKLILSHISHQFATEISSYKILNTFILGHLESVISFQLGNEFPETPEFETNPFIPTHFLWDLTY